MAFLWFAYIWLWPPCRPPGQPSGGVPLRNTRLSRKKTVQGPADPSILTSGPRTRYPGVPSTPTSSVITTRTARGATERQGRSSRNDLGPLCCRWSFWYLFLKFYCWDVTISCLLLSPKHGRSSFAKDNSSTRSMLMKIFKRFLVHMQLPWLPIIF